MKTDRFKNRLGRGRDHVGSSSTRHWSSISARRAHIQIPNDSLDWVATFYCRGWSRILVREPSRVLTPEGGLSPKFAQNRGFFLKIAWKLNDFEKILGARGGRAPGPPGSASVTLQVNRWMLAMVKMFLNKKSLSCPVTLALHGQSKFRHQQLNPLFSSFSVFFFFLFHSLCFLEYFFNFLWFGFPAGCHLPAQNYPVLSCSGSAAAQLCPVLHVLRALLTRGPSAAHPLVPHTGPCTRHRPIHHHLTGTRFYTESPGSWLHKSPSVRSISLCLPLSFCTSIFMQSLFQI